MCAFEDIDLTGNIEIVLATRHACISGFAVLEKGPAQFRTRPMPSRAATISGGLSRENTFEGRLRSVASFAIFAASLPARIGLVL
jgi:hypothetical protein